MFVTGERKQQRNLIDYNHDVIIKWFFLMVSFGLVSVCRHLIHWNFRFKDCLLSQCAHAVTFKAQVWVCPSSNPDTSSDHFQVFRLTGMPPTPASLVFLVTYAFVSDTFRLYTTMFDRSQNVISLSVDNKDESLQLLPLTSVSCWCTDWHCWQKS